MAVTISHDLMVHPSRSNIKCAHITDTCYQPAPHLFLAQEAGQEGCECTETVCTQVCRRATPLDAEARYIHYEGRDKHADLNPQDKNKGKGIYGYASNPDRLIDDRFTCAWTLRSDLGPANAYERMLFPHSLDQLQARFP